MFLVIDYYQLLPSFYWRWLYRRLVKKDASISVEDFRDLYIFHRAFAISEQVKEWHRQLLFAPLRLLNPISDLLQSRWFEDQRLAYAQYFSLFFYRQYLNFHQTNDKGSNIIRVISCETRSPFVCLTLYHSLVSRTNMVRYAKTALNQFLHLPKEGIQTKRLDKNHLQVIFATPQ